MGNQIITDSSNFLQVLFSIFIITVIFPVSEAQQGSHDLMDDRIQSSYYFYQPPEYPRDCTYVRDECSSSNSSGVFLIKAEGYPDPFEVYCNSIDHSGGWTVSLFEFGSSTRVDGSLSFNREWDAYKIGFGFLQTEFWIGNDKLAYLTNQAVYELRIDIVLSNGTSLFASFSEFRVSDEGSQYKLVLIGPYSGDITWSSELHCPPNMKLGSCSACQPSCDDPTGVNNCDGNCADQDEVCICSSGLLLKDGECVLPDECGCLEGEIHVNANCTEKCTCENGRLICNSSYKCSSNENCMVKNGVRQCYCIEGFDEDGEMCNPFYTDCYDAYQDGRREDGIYTILPAEWPGSPFNVSCDMTTAGGGWTVFQRRVDGVTDFYRNWEDYKHGFGSVAHDRDFSLGNEQLHYLTSQKDYRLRIDIVNPLAVPIYAEYTSFEVGPEYNKYRLKIGSYSGDAGNGMLYTGGRLFSTHDQDNDACSYQECAKGHRGGWWYYVSPGSCRECRFDFSPCNNFATNASCTNRCAFSNLNGNYNGRSGEIIFWNDNRICNVFSAEMKLRPSVS